MILKAYSTNKSKFILLLLSRPSERAEQVEGGQLRQSCDREGAMHT
jgi:hypothetical protein